MLGIKVKSAVKCHLFTLPRLSGELSPAADKNPRGNTAIIEKLSYGLQESSRLRMQRRPLCLLSIIGVSCDSHLQPKIRNYPIFRNEPIWLCSQ